MRGSIIGGSILLLLLALLTQGQDAGFENVIALTALAFWAAAVAHLTLSELYHPRRLRLLLPSPARSEDVHSACTRELKPALAIAVLCSGLALGMGVTDGVTGMLLMTACLALATLPLAALALVLRRWLRSVSWIGPAVALSLLLLLPMLPGPEPFQAAPAGWGWMGLAAGLLAIPLAGAPAFFRWTRRFHERDELLTVAFPQPRSQRMAPGRLLLERVPASWSRAALLLQRVTYLHRPRHWGLAVGLPLGLVAVLSAWLSRSAIDASDLGPIMLLVMIVAVSAFLLASLPRRSAGLEASMVGLPLDRFAMLLAGLAVPASITVIASVPAAAMLCRGYFSLFVVLVGGVIEATFLAFGSLVVLAAAVGRRPVDAVGEIMRGARVVVAVAWGGCLLFMAVVAVWPLMSGPTLFTQVAVAAVAGGELWDDELLGREIASAGGSCALLGWGVVAAVHWCSFRLWWKQARHRGGSVPLPGSRGPS